MTTPPESPQQRHNNPQAEQRRLAQNSRDYTQIYSYLQQQLLYLKRRVSRQDAAVQTDLQIPLEPLDENCLMDVCRALCDEYRRSQGGDIDLSNVLHTTTAVASSPVHTEAPGTPHSPMDSSVAMARSDRVALGSSLSEGGVVMESSVKMVGRSMTSRFQSDEQLTKVKAENVQAMKVLEAKLKGQHDNAMEEVQQTMKMEAATSLKKAEMVWKQREEQLLAEKLKTAAVAKYEATDLTQKLDALKKIVTGLEQERDGLLETIQAKDALLFNAHKDHIEYNVTEKERSVEGAARISAATASLVQVLQQKEVDLHEARSADLISRLSATFALRESILTRSAEDAFAKLAALQSDHENLLRQYVTVSDTMSRAFAEKIVIQCSHGSKSARNAGAAVDKTKGSRMELVPPPKPEPEAALTWRAYQQVPRSLPEKAKRAPVATPTPPLATPRVARTIGVRVPRPTTSASHRSSPA